MPIVILKVRSEELMQTIFIKRPSRFCWICAISRWVHNLQIYEYPWIAQRNRAQSVDCTDPATAPSTFMSAKHSHSMFILSRGDMVKHEVGVCMCVHVRAVYVCSESMNDVTVNAKNNLWMPCIISPVLDWCLKTSDSY